MDDGSRARRSDAARWSISFGPVAPEDRRAYEAIVTVAEAEFGSRGLGRVDDAVSWPLLLAAGMYTSDEVPDLIHGPIWTSLHLEPATGWEEHLELDLRHGIVRRRLHHESNESDASDVEVRRFMSAASPGVGVQVVSGPVDAIVIGDPLVAPPSNPCTRTSSWFVDGVEVMSVSDQATERSVAVAAHDVVVDSRLLRSIERVAGFGADLADQAAGTARQRLAEGRRAGVDELEQRHRAVWVRRWNRCGTEFASRPDLEQAVRFATYHLLCAGSPKPAPTNGGTSSDDDRASVPDELAIGARGLTGTSYRGHVFWDTDVFVAPALSAIAPDGARRALNYRSNRLAAAARRAASDGHRGARFPWESAHDGTDVTPRSGTTVQGESVEILTGVMEEHITADIAWSVWNHVNWTGDIAYLASDGLDLLVGVARYWADRISIDDDGSAHIRGVIGPDEYHEDVDDNVFTNVMVRHALDVAARTARRFGRCDERETGFWQELGAALVDGYDPTTGLYEQFAGYAELTPIVTSSVAEPPMPADVLIGRDVIQSTQIIKQPDVMMAYHLVPQLMRSEAFHANLDFYMDRTAHGSSLSPAIGASLLFRAGRGAEALQLFELAAFLDLDDLTGTTPGGLHMATMGGVWQAVTFGLLGLRADERGLTCDPMVPAELGRVAHRLMFHGGRIDVVVEGDHATLEGSAPFRAEVNGEGRVARHQRLERRSAGWEHR